MSVIELDHRKVARVVLSILAGALVLAATHGAVRAASRTFVLPSSSGYGISDCLGKEKGCDEVVASAWCEAQGFAHPLAYGKAEDMATGKIANASAPAAGTTKLDPDAYVVTCGD
ncbi:MAG: hypothetical protein ACLP8A_01480 [Methylovirgula sp.]